VCLCIHLLFYATTDERLKLKVLILVLRRIIMCASILFCASGVLRSRKEAMTLPLVTIFAQYIMISPSVKSRNPSAGYNLMGHNIVM
jgi:hypothetical protein